MAREQQPCGPAFPFGIDPVSGRIATSAGPAKFRDNLTHLLLTGMGERVMARRYGAGVARLLQEGVNEALLAVAQREVGRAILEFEPRVIPRGVAVLPRGDQLVIRVDYVEAGATASQTVIVPVD
jgi:phage baseplate assembly protein W